MTDSRDAKLSMTRPAAPRRLGVMRRGHTMIETLVVMAVIATLAGIAGPRMNYSGMRLDANVRVARAVFQQAWRGAIKNQHDMLVSIDTVADNFRIVEDMNNDGLVTTGERITFRPLEDGVVFDVPASGVRAASRSRSQALASRRCSRCPRSPSAATAQRAAISRSTCRSSHRGVKQFRGVTVSQATGRTEWFRLVNGTWWRSGGI